MTYVMTRSPPTSASPPIGTSSAIEEGYRHWGLPLAELERALTESPHELNRRGINRYEPDGRKRLRAIIAEYGRSRPTDGLGDRPDVVGWRNRFHGGIYPTHLASLHENSRPGWVLEPIEQARVVPPRAGRDT